MFPQFKVDIQVQSDIAQKEARKGEELKKELSQAKSDLENRTAELKTKTENLQRAQEDITKLDQQLKEQRVNLLRVFIQFSFIFKCSCQYSCDRKKKLLGFPRSWILLELERNGFQVLMMIFDLFFR